MKKLFKLLLVLPATVLVLSGCAFFQGPAAASLGQPLTLGVGQSVRLADEGMVIKFNKIIGDSRSTMLEQIVPAVCTYQCPTVVEYIWDGTVDSLLTVRYQGKTYLIVLKQPGLTNEAEDSFAGYTFKFNITPYPNGTKPVDANKYQLLLTVTRE